MPDHRPAHKIPFMAASCLLLALSHSANAVDTIVINADIRTADPAQPRAQALAINKGRFIAVGSNDYVSTLATSKTQRINAQGRTLLPGFSDSHNHMSHGVDLISGVDLYKIPKKTSWLAQIKNKNEQLPPGQWITGGRWDHTLAEHGILPTKEDLDRVAPNRPVALFDNDYHSIWVNSKALALAGINAQTPAPAGGEIVKNPTTGEPTGILKESAINLILNAPAYQQSRPNPAAALQKTMQHLNSVGITAAHNMADTQALASYQTLLQQQDYSLRIWFGAFAEISDNSSHNQQLLADFKQTQTSVNKLAAQAEQQHNSGPLFRFGYVKLFADGVMSTYTAALNEPYADKPDTHGHPVISQDHLTDFVSLANAQGFPVAIHAIGDHTVDMALKAYSHSDSPLKNRIEHLEIITLASIQRLQALGVTASMQAEHSIGDDYILDRIGEPRAERAYAWKKLLSGGVPLVLGSDWPTGPLPPLEQLAAAVLRERNQQPWHAENALSFDEALYAYTQASANMTPWAADIGSVSVGKWADFVLLDGKIPQPADSSLRLRRVASTYFAGRQVYPQP